MKKNTRLQGALLVLLLATGSLRAGIISIPEPFSGDLMETWEEFALGYAGSAPISIFNGQASISGSNPYVWKTTYNFFQPGGMGLGAFRARAFDGTQGYASSSSPATGRINFNSPVSDFGGYWACSTGNPQAFFTFYNTQGSIIGSEVFTYTSPNNNGTLEWQGWQSTEPISSVEYTGRYVTNDSLRINVVPEPSSLAMIGLISGCALFIRRFFCI